MWRFSNACGIVPKPFVSGRSGPDSAWLQHEPALQPALGLSENPNGVGVCTQTAILHVGQFHLATTEVIVPASWYPGGVVATLWLRMTGTATRNHAVQYCTKQFSFTVKTKLDLIFWGEWDTARGLMHKFLCVG